ncbi:MAG: phage tail tube protein [Nitrospinota bacterium]
MAQGREIVAAAKKASLWGTPVLQGAGDGILILSEGLGAGVPEDLPDESAGLAFVESSDQGNLDIAGSVVAFLRYEGLDFLLAAAMGSAGTPVQQGLTAAYQNTYSLAGSLDGVFGTLVIDKKVSVWEWPGVKVHGFTISGEAGQPLRAEVLLIADRLNRNTASGTNNQTTVASITYPTRANRVLMSQGKVRVNDQSGAALADGDAVNVSRFALRYRRPMSQDHVVGSPDILEPTEDGMPSFGLEIAFPEYTEDTYLADLGAETLKKLDLTLTGATIESPYSYQFQVNIPQAKLVNAEAAVDGAGKIVHPLTFRLEKAASAPAGMTVTNPFEIVVTNKRTASPLA